MKIIRISENENRDHISEFLQRKLDFFTPKFTLPLDENWDTLLNYLMDEFPVKAGSAFVLHGHRHTKSISLGDFDIWVSNYPYGYGYQIDSNGRAISGRPYSETIKRLREYCKTPIVT